MVAILAALAVGGCGGGSSSASDEEEATYRASIVTDRFPAEQRLAETNLMRVGVHNDGERTIPAVVVSVTLGGKAGRSSSLPFGIRSEEPGLASPDRPVWVLSEHYPKLDGSDQPGGAEIANGKSFLLGPLKPDRTVEAVWQLTASRTGSYDIHYEVDAGLGGKARAETAAGTRPRGDFSVTITDQTPDTTVNDNGEVVEIEAEPGPGEDR